MLELKTVSPTGALALSSCTAVASLSYSLDLCSVFHLRFLHHLHLSTISSPSSYIRRVSFPFFSPLFSLIPFTLLPLTLRLSLSLSLSRQFVVSFSSTALTFAVDEDNCDDLSTFTRSIAAACVYAERT